MTLLTGGESMERLFDLDWQLIADSTLTIIAVFFLLIILSYLLFEPARKILQDRKQRIKDELEQTRKDMEQAQALRKEYEDRLQGIDKEAQQILSSARQKAVENEGRIIAEAKAEAARIMDRAHTEAVLEKSRLADEVKQEIISVAGLMAGRIVSASIDEEQQRHLIEETLKEIGEDTWLS